MRTAVTRNRISRKH